MKRQGLTPEERAAMQQEALSRAVQGQSLTNFPAILEGFLSKGIPESDIVPRENVFTFNAWKALGRFVRKGEHGVKVSTVIPTSRTVRDDATGKEKTIGGRYLSTATVFHVSQTEVQA
jgi:hypothetical protein